MADDPLPALPELAAAGKRVVMLVALPVPGEVEMLVWWPASPAQEAVETLASWPVASLVLGAVEKLVYWPDFV